MSNEEEGDVTLPNTYVTTPQKRSTAAVVGETIGVLITTARMLVIVIFLTLTIQSSSLFKTEQECGLDKRTIFQAYVVSYTVSTMATCVNVVAMIERDDAAYNDPRLELLSFHLAGVGFSMVSQVTAAAMLYMEGCSGLDGTCDAYWNMLSLAMYLLVDACLYSLLYQKRKFILNGQVVLLNLPYVIQEN
ncbi:hypothetical protein Ocin01_01726 [Orchesella cincta]|uniref:Uncharacterized protein n=1 Tax=Orchesella cincta TaxID=48709 RepID=A0A1D2NJ35_ORCCI|nr:hypothetical protein Ocin01_01726 [Orchesella cincta]